MNIKSQILKYTNRRFLYQIGCWIVLYFNYFHKTWVICSFLKVKQSTAGLSFKHGDHGDVGNHGKETNIKISLTDFKAKINKSKINKYKINNNNKTNPKHEFNVKYERYKQDISKDRKLCLGKKCNIWSSLIPPPLLLRQLKNNQNQTNTTGAQNFKELNNSAGWLFVFFVFFFGMN